MKNARLSLPCYRAPSARAILRLEERRRIIRSGIPEREEGQRKVLDSIVGNTLKAVEDLQPNAHTECYVELPMIGTIVARLACDVRAVSQPWDDAVFRTLILSDVNGVYGAWDIVASPRCGLSCCPRLI